MYMQNLITRLSNMYVEKEQWIMLIVCGIILTLGYNFGLAIRDTKGIESLERTEVVYKQIPVIPFTN